MRKKSSSASSNALKLMQLSVAAPQVVGHRVARMAKAGLLPNARDQKEFIGMVVEKQVAFVQSWVGMASEMGKLQQQFFLAPFLGRRPNLQKSLNAVAAKGIEPVRRKAVANAKRLSRSR